MSRKDPLYHPVSFSVASAAAGSPHFVLSDLEASNTDSRHVKACFPTDYFQFKAWVDWSLVLALMTIVLPMIACIAALIAIRDGRPVFYRQVRVGKDLKPFLIWKFRSMRQNAEDSTGPVWCAPNDERVTRLGAWLRATHLDELPQFFNVLSGSMHLIGPRPERPEFVESLACNIPRYYQRHAVRPGITGLAQVKQGYDSNLGNVATKLSMDIEYIESASLWNDLKILFMTIPYVAREVIEFIRRKVEQPAQPTSRTLETTQNRDAASLSAEIAVPLEPSLESQIHVEIMAQRADLKHTIHAPHESPKLHHASREKSGEARPSST